MTARSRSQVPAVPAPEAPAPLWAVLLVTFLGSISSGGFWAGIFFVTANWYGFSSARNLALASLMGAVYAVAAALAGRLLRAVELWLSPRLALAVTLWVWGLAAILPLGGPGVEWLLWVAAVIGAAASAIMYPIVESYLTAGRQGADMRGAIGWFNVTWTPATAISLLMMPLLAPTAVLWTLAITGVANALACSLLLCLSARPAVHPPDASGSTHGREYPQLLRAASWLLPLSYVMSSSLAPVLPHRLRSLGAATASSVIAAIWMLARFTTLFAMWRTGFWHGRWPTLVGAALALVCGVVTVLLGSSLTVVVCGLVAFGIGMGLTYYCALYYSLALGHGAVDAGGSFEALIGVGYFVGPLVGLAAHALGGPSNATTDPDGDANVATVIIILLISAPVLLKAARSYLQARQSRAA